MIPIVPVITLLTDFGVRDHYVGVLKGVILSIVPTAALVDLSHEVAPQAVGEGAFLLLASHRYFPPGTVHLAVVDPGVGTSRRAVAVQTQRATFVGPDNGLLGAALWGERIVASVELAEPRFMAPTISSTFHGRDVFAPVAAHVSRGVPLADLGPPAPDLAPCPWSLAHPGPDGAVHGRVIYVDRYGNLITNVPNTVAASLVAQGRIDLEVAGRRVSYYAATFGLAPDRAPAAIPDSSGLLQIAVPNGSAADALDVAVGAEVALHALTSPESVDRHR